jgi:hypothetical protein
MAKSREECSKDGCHEAPVALGLCNLHYNAQPEVRTRAAAFEAKPENKANRDRGDVLRVRVRKSKMAQEDYDGILADQSDGCAICGSVIPGGNGRFHVDHDHACCPGKSCGKCVRGLLCVNCNFMLGHAQDDPDVLRAAADYLERHQMTLEESP